MRRAYPEFLITIAGWQQFGINFHCVARHCDIQLLIVCEKRTTQEIFDLTENMGGTEASSPVVFNSVVTGIMTSARGAGGCFTDDSKNVACSVARPWTDHQYILMYH